MLIRVPKGWEIPEREATPESVYIERRRFLGRALSVAGLAAVGRDGLPSGRSRPSGPWLSRKAGCSSQLQIPPAAPHYPI